MIRIGGPAPVDRDAAVLVTSVIRGNGDKSVRGRWSEPGIAASLPRNRGAPTEASLVSWLPLTTIRDRPSPSRGLNAHLGSTLMAPYLSFGLSVPHRDTSFGSGFASCSPGLQKTL
jgi:hypothetical protein